MPMERILGLMYEPGDKPNHPTNLQFFPAPCRRWTDPPGVAERSHRDISAVAPPLVMRYVSSWCAGARMTSIFVSSLAMAAPPGLASETIGQVNDSVKSAHLGDLLAIPAGTFLMGRTPAQEAAQDPDKVQHEVTLTKGFLLMEHEVTQGQWTAVMESNPSAFPACGVQCPVDNVSWVDAEAFAARVSVLEGVIYRLPTEAEWEYAARGGQVFMYSGASDVGLVAWTVTTSRPTPHIVCQKARNDYGLCDMSGNVWEWVADWYGDYGRSAVTNPHGADSGEERVFRGGCWGCDPGDARVAIRNKRPPATRVNTLGFRLARDL